MGETVQVKFFNRRQGFRLSADMCGGESCITSPQCGFRMTRLEETRRVIFDTGVDAEGTSGICARCMTNYNTI